jgi:hypothetical protein
MESQHHFFITMWQRYYFQTDIQTALSFLHAHVKALKPQQSQDFSVKFSCRLLTFPLNWKKCRFWHTYSTEQVQQRRICWCERIQGD